jgi:hypothetical protein
MTPLEQRYRLLLRAYPGRYRRERGEEIIGTLLEATPAGQNWPRPRDTRTLIMGGLRVRAGQDQRLTTAVNLRLAALLGVALALLWLIAGNLVTTIAIQVEYHQSSPGQIACCVLALAAVAAAWFAPRLAVAGLALTAAALWIYWGQGGHLLALQPAGLLISLAPLTLGQERLPRSWLWLAGGLFALTMAPALSPPGGSLSPQLLTLTIVTPLIALGVVVVWSILDARPLIAMTVFLASYLLSMYLPAAQAGHGGPLISPIWLVPAAVTAVLAAAGVWRLRRQAVL